VSCGNNQKCPVALIPAFKPAPAIIDIARALFASDSFSAIVAVDDGSGPEFSKIFEKLISLDVIVLHHTINLGKGLALRTGMNHIAWNYPNSVGIVSLDADGQHLSPDVVVVANTLSENPGALILGSRCFDTSTPLRSRFGNEATRLVMRIIGGLKIRDTQTGLRGIPLALVPSLLRLRTSGYDFELDMLLQCRQQGMSIIETPIATVYIDNNRSSHFNPFWDSLKIYLVFLRFNLSSLLSVVIDYSFFSIIFASTGSVAAGQISARASAGAVNYFVNRHFVFKSNRSHLSGITLYVCILAFMGFASYCIINLLHHSMMVNVYFAKVISEAILYAASFVIQRDIVFSPRITEE